LTEISAARQHWQYTVVCRQEVERLHGAEMKIFDYLVEKLRKLFMIRNLTCCQAKDDIWSISLNKTKQKA
jgi:hypothetical protein